MPNNYAALNWLDDKHAEMLEKVVQICGINSGTGNLPGIEEVGQHLADWFGRLGAELRTVELPPRTTVDSHGEQVTQQLGSALHFVMRPHLRPRVLLCIHMDTVYPQTSPFQSCKMLDDGRINGPGVADAKGGLIVMLYALLAFEQTADAGKIGWEVIINPDEELGSPSSNDFLRERAANSDWGMLFEPTLPDGTLVSWRKGTGNFDFVVRGVSAHSGREFDKGRNAIVAMSRLMSSIHDLNTNPDITYNVGRVEGGGPLNVVPNLAIGRVNVRLKSAELQNDVLHHFDRLAAQIQELDGISIERHGFFSSPPKPLDEKAKMFQTRIEECGNRLGIEIKWRGTGGASDGNKFAAAGLPNVDTFGPRGGDIHSFYEYMIPESLVERAKLTAAVLISLTESP